MTPVRIVTIVSAIALLGAGCAAVSRPSAALPPPARAPAKTETPRTSSPSPSPTVKTVTVELTGAGFSPATVTVAIGDTVRFVNVEPLPHWPASGVHPTHQVCPGFDARRGLAQGEAYSFTFTEAKTCPFHDHLFPQMRGTVIITP